MKKHPVVALCLVLLAIVITGTYLTFGVPSGDRAGGKHGMALPPFSLPDMDNHLRNSEEWRGQVLVINFLAAWCPPCREEAPLFAGLHKRYQGEKVQVIGVAFDRATSMRKMARELQLNFPILIGGAKGVDLAKKLGNRIAGLPFTVIIDRNGKMQFAKIGKVTDKWLSSHVKHLM